MGVNRETLFEIYCMSIDIRPTISLFRVFYKLCKQGHWFSFENKTGRGMRKCFKEVTTSLKGWKKNFFLIDRRAIPDAMPWRHGDTDLHDYFPSNFNQDDVDRLSEFLVPLRPPPRHLLYVCGLTTACRHPELPYHIKDQDRNVINMDTFLKLPTWTGTIVSKGDPIPEGQRPNPRVSPPLPEGSKIPELTVFQKSVEKPNAKIAVAREKKKNRALLGLRLNVLPATIIAAEVVKGGPYVEKEVVDLSAQSHQSSHLGHEDELVHNRYVPNWELRNDLRVCTYRACRESVSHVATPAEDNLDAELTELEHLRAGLRKANQDNEKLTKKFTLLDNAHLECSSQEKEFLDMVKELERERDEWRATTSGQVEKIRLLEKDLEPKTQQLMVAEEKVEALEREKLYLSAQLSQGEADRKKLVKEFILAVVKRLHTSVEYRKSLATPVQLCFTAGWLGGLTLGRTEDEVARFLSETQDLDIEGSNELWSVYPDVPPPEGATSGVATESTIQQPPSTSPKIASGTPFGTTT
ncbi:hypothetical protein Tco_0725798 [Tanacetum coccineum]|uniref:Transposase (Putative), gypsy type n=1 Tax=Tanacetum coccineum TaxID=301880 RepID=A0ABQ4YES1_9ASTR